MFKSLTNYFITNIIKQTYLDIIKKLFVLFYKIIKGLIINNKTLYKKHKKNNYKKNNYYNICFPLIFSTNI